MKGLDDYPDILGADLNTLKEFQLLRLREHLTYCRKHSPYYATLWKDADFEVDHITLDQLSKLPLTEKSDLEKYNDDFCAAPLTKVVDIVLSSGTTGLPTKIMYTDHDLKRLAYNEEQSFKGCGLSSNDLVLLTCTIDRCFVAGLAYFLGLRNLGAAAIRNGLNSLESHFEVIKRMSPSAIIGVPTFLRKLGLFFQKEGLDPASTSVSKLVCIGEPLRDKNLELLKVGQDLQNLWQAEIFSTYASSEIVTTFCECTAQRGGHFHPGLAVVEIVDEHDQVVSPGSVGEVVVTPLAVEGMPLVRFKTGDISFLIDEPCACGRFSPRLGPILGRKKQMMKIFGTTLYPQAIYSALEEIKAIEEYFIVVSSQSDLSDRIAIYIALNEALNEGSSQAETIQRRLAARLRVKPEVIITDGEAVKQQVYSSKARKPVRFIDQRGLD